MPEGGLGMMQLVWLLAVTQSATAQESRPDVREAFRYTKNGVVGLNFSPDGKYLVLGGEDYLVVLNAATFETIKRLHQEDLVDEVLFDPGSSFLVSRSRGPDTVLWDVPTFKEMDFSIRVPEERNDGTLP